MTARRIVFASRQGFLDDWKSAQRMAQAHQELETAREALHGWLDELPMVFEGFVFTKGDEELRIARIHTPQSLAKEIESKWCPEGE